MLSVSFIKYLLIITRFTFSLLFFSSNINYLIEFLQNFKLNIKATKKKLVTI